VGAVFDFGKVAVGAARDVKFRVRNQGAAGVNLTAIAVNGSGFSAPNLPTLPYPLAPGTLLEFTVHFAASASATSSSANLIVNSIQTLLTVTIAPTATIAVLPGCTGADPIDFGRVQRGQSATCTFTLSNPNAQTITVATLAVTGNGFSPPAGVRAPIQLHAGESVQFTITFTPVDSVPYSAQLAADVKTVRLTGIGFDPPMPKPTLTFDSTAIASAQQRTLSLTLPSSAIAQYTGNVVLSFTPNTALNVDDPSVMFVNASRVASFTIQPGDTQALFDGKPQVRFQTGMTAGTIRFTVNNIAQGIAGDPTTSITLAATPIVIDSATGVRRVSDLDVNITAFDNTYSAGSMSFTFYDTAGHTIDPGSIAVDYSANFKTFFGAGQGSAFLLRVTFPVSGDATQVAGADVTLSNTAGSAHTQRIAFQ
jgi:hypothetical protein